MRRHVFRRDARPLRFEFDPRLRKCGRGLRKTPHMPCFPAGSTQCFFGPPRLPRYGRYQQIPTTSSLFAVPALLILGDDNVRFRAHCPKGFTERECLGLLSMNHSDGFDLALDVIDVTAQFVFVGMA